MSRLLAALLLPLTALLVLAPAPPAAAHATLIATDPAERTATVLVGRALQPEGFRDSALYSPDYPRRFREGAA